MSLLISTSKGNRRVSREALDMVPMPEYTSTHRPVAYGDAVDYLKHQIQALDLRIRGEQYGLNKAGDQMFGLISAEPESTGDKSHCLSFGLRQSYNKTLSMGLAVGAQVLVCDNLCFSGDAFKVLRKNTLNVWRDFQAMVAIQMKMAFAHYDSVKADMAILKDTPCNVRRGYSFLGVMVGEGLMTPTQANVAYGDWREPRHAEFADRNMWGLYNAVTEGLKKGAPARTLERHAVAHAFLTEQCKR